MRLRDRGEVVILGHHGQAVFDRGGSDERVGEPDDAVDACGVTVVHESRPGDHDGFWDRQWVRGSCEREGVRSPGLEVRVGCRENPEQGTGSTPI